MLLHSLLKATHPYNLDINEKTRNEYVKMIKPEIFSILNPFKGELSPCLNIRYL